MPQIWVYASAVHETCARMMMLGCAILRPWYLKGPPFTAMQAVWKPGMSVNSQDMHVHISRMGRTANFGQ